MTTLYPIIGIDLAEGPDRCAHALVEVLNGELRMTPLKSDLVDIAGELRRETERAFLVFDGAREVWLPKALIEHDPDDNTFAMPEWLAKEKGLI